MRLPEKRKVVMARSKELGHCICNPKQPCPCDVFYEHDLCPCAGERPDPQNQSVRLTQQVRKAGCASKIGKTDLQRVLSLLPVVDDPNVLVGVAAGDDAGIYKLDGEWNLVQTVDVFSPVVDDPYTFGQICAANSVSDIYAMGGKPICALSVIGFPIETLSHEVMASILRGGVETLRDAGVSVLGGHSINDEELKCGFAVTGLIQGNGSVLNNSAQPGDVLVLTKPIGTGLISFGDQIQRVSGEARKHIADSMAELNKDAAELMIAYQAHACTDVTGFGLAGHLSQMMDASHTTAEIDLAAIPVFAEALWCVENNIIPGAIERNRESFAESISAKGDGEPVWLDLLFDAQTSGGLLVALSEEHADSYVNEMKERGHNSTSHIGCVTNRNQALIQVTINQPNTLVGEYPKTSPVNVQTETEQFDCCSSSTTHESQSNEPCCESFATVSKTEGNRNMTANPSSESIATSSSAPQLFQSFMKVANAPGVLDAKTKKMLAIALSISERCQPCLQHHLKSALEQGISMEEIDEAAWMAIAFCGAPAKMFYEETKGNLISNISNFVK